MKAFFLILSAAWIFAAPKEPLYTVHTPPWQGVWIWAPPLHTPPSAEIDLRRWVEKRPGGSGKSIINRLLGNAAIMGVRTIVWQLDDGMGKALYPEGNGSKVLSYPNWGLDFSKFDYPAEAAAVASRLNMDLFFSVSPEFYSDAVKRYRNQRVVLRSRAPVTRLRELDIVGENRYFPRGEVEFRKRFRITEKPDRADLCVTANGSYMLRIDGKKIGRGNDYSRASTYDIASLLEPGEHEIRISAIPQEMAGVLVNFRYGKGGKEHLLVSDSSWECRISADSPWIAPVPSGFEGAGRRFRLKEPWMYRTPGIPLLEADPENPKSPEPCEKFDVQGKALSLEGAYPPRIRDGMLCFDAGDAAGKAWYSFPEQKKGVLEIEFDFEAEAPVYGVNLAVLPRESGKKLDHGLSLIWLGWDSRKGELQSFSEDRQWQCIARYSPKKKHHLKLRLNLSGKRAGTFDVNLDGGEYESFSVPFRNLRPELSAASLCFVTRRCRNMGTSLKIDNLSISNKKE